MIYRLALAQVECTYLILLNSCKQNITSLSLLIGTTVGESLLIKSLPGMALVNLISKDANLVFYLSVYLPTDSLFKLAIMAQFSISVISDVIQKVQRHPDLINFVLFV